ncbi:MAG TPA: hypothetical protein VF070_46960 [Streptosporangiaceae bacterium]
MSKQVKRRLGSDFTLGGEQAEADLLLEKGFYESGLYRAIVSRRDSRAFLVGRTGGGKSALLQHLETERPDHVIRINPENLSLPYITGLGAVQYLSEIGLNLDPLFIALWKHVVLVEIIRHRYKVDTPTAKQNFLRTLMEKINREPSKKQALEYLDDFEGKFWLETDERIRDIITKFEQEVDKEAEASFGVAHVVGLKAGVTSTKGMSTEVKSAQAERFQRIVNATQLARLNKMMDVLDEDILDSPQNYTYVVIDDLDRDWIDEKVANDLIRCLFRAVLDLKRIQHLKILVALRTNIFEELDFGSRTGGQEEKFRALTLNVRWTMNELIGMLSERARAAAEQYSITGLGSIDDLVPNPNATRGNALEYILNRTLMRPRDAIAYLNECLALASGKPKLTWELIHNAERSYSYKRLLALRDEWKPTYPGIDDVFKKFTQATEVMSRNSLTKILDEAILLMADRAFSGVVWMTTLSEPVWDSTQRDWAEMYHPLFRLLFNLGFLGCRLPREDVIIYVHDQPEFAESINNLSRSTEFYIHPAFRAALDAKEVIDSQAWGDPSDKWQ